MDDARALGSPGAGAERPRARLLVAGGQERASPEQVVRRPHDPRKRPLAQPEPLEELGSLRRVELGRLRLELHADAEGFDGCVPERSDSVAQLRRHGLDQRVGIGDLVLAEVDDREHRLGREEEEGPERVALVRGQLRPVYRRSRLQRLDRGLERGRLPRQRLVGLGRLPPAIELALCAREIGEHELELERVEVVERVGAAGNLGVLEGTQHEHDGIDLADAGQEPVAQPLTGGRARDEPGDVDQLDIGVHDLARLAHPGEGVEPVVGHVRHPDVGLGRRERVRRDHRVPTGNGVEQR